MVINIPLNGFELRSPRNISCSCEESSRIQFSAPASCTLRSLPFHLTYMSNTKTPSHLYSNNKLLYVCEMNIIIHVCIEQCAFCFALGRG